VGSDGHFWTARRTITGQLSSSAMEEDDDGRFEVDADDRVARADKVIE
jgi:hypothetical protein